MSEIVHVPFRDGEIFAVEIDGKPHIVLRPALEAIGLDYSAQRRKIQGRSWACMVPVTTQLPGDTQQREVVTVSVRTFLMLLATINEAHVAEAVRPALIAYQLEVADVIEAYFTKGKIGEHGFEYTPLTWTFDEVCSLLEQRWHLRLNTVQLGQLLRTSGVFKQAGGPTSDFRLCFWYTGTAYTMHPHAFPKVAKRLFRVDQQIKESYGIQMRLELEGVGQSELAS